MIWALLEVLWEAGLKIKIFLLLILISISILAFEISPRYWDYIFVKDTENSTYSLIKCDGVLVKPLDTYIKSDKFYVTPKFQLPDKFSIIIYHEGVDLLHFDKNLHKLIIKADTLKFVLKNPITDDDLGTYHYQDFVRHNFTIQNESYEFNLTPFQMNRIVNAKNVYLTLYGRNRNFSATFSYNNKIYWKKFYAELKKQLTEND